MLRCLRIHNEAMFELKHLYVQDTLLASLVIDVDSLRFLNHWMMRSRTASYRVVKEMMAEG